MSPSGQLTEKTRQKLRFPVGVTFVGLWAERITQAFWPLWSVLFVCLAALMLGLQDMVSVEILWAATLCAGLSIFATALWGVIKFRRPWYQSALDRVDETLVGRPISALSDEQAIGANDAMSQKVWEAHIARMETRAAAARPVEPDLRVSHQDPFALRYVALLCIAVAVLFGSLWRVSSLTNMVPQAQEIAVIGPAWEGWVEPPAYTGKPSLYLNDITRDTFEVPLGSQVTLRLYGEVGALIVSETVSGRTDADEIEPATAAQQSFEVVQSGDLIIDGAGGQSWSLNATADLPPVVDVLDGITAQADGEMSQTFEALDDYGVVSGKVRVTLDVGAVTREHGLTVTPEPRPELVMELPMPFAGDRADFNDVFQENQSLHAFANLPVVMTYEVTDEAGQTGYSEPQHVVLPGRRFFDPLAKSVVEQRRDLLWSRENAGRVAQLLRAVSHRPDDIFRSETAYLRLRFILRRLETMTAFGLKPEQQEEIAQALWDLAVVLEEGTLADAYERLKRAQDQLAEAMRNGASDEEIAALMDELREAMDDYMRQLAQQNPQDGQDPQQAQNGTEVTQDELQALLDEIERLMQEGQMAEAQSLMEQLNQMMENMQVQQGQGGNGPQTPGEQAMEDLAESLREQQGLSDEAFRDLQEQFNPNAQTGENSQNQGRNGGQGQGQDHSDPSGDQSGEQGEGQSQGGQQQGLADRQQALRDELNRQQGNLPGAGTPEGDAARESLGRAGDAMDQAENALRKNDLAGAIDNQAEAIEALREGMQSLAEEMREEQRQQAGQGSQSDQAGTQQGRGEQQDPLGRSQGTHGDVNSGEGLLQGEDVYRRARELLDEIRKRSSDGDRPEIELEYLKRLLDRF